MSDLNVADAKAKIDSGEDTSLGGGAQFWAYISPSNNTSSCVGPWFVRIIQGSWSGEINSSDPYKILTTPGLSGIFQVVVMAYGKGFGWRQLKPQSGSQPDVGCNSNCRAMVGIVANAACSSAEYWTVWDAVCS